MQNLFPDPHEKTGAPPDAGSGTPIAPQSPKVPSAPNVVTYHDVKPVGPMRFECRRCGTVVTSTVPLPAGWPNRFFDVGPDNSFFQLMLPTPPKVRFITPCLDQRGDTLLPALGKEEA